MGRGPAQNGAVAAGLSSRAKGQCYDGSMADHSTIPAPEAGAPTDRVGSLSARLSEALTAVGIAVRRREAEIELIDRTLEASSDAQSAAARQAAERMARVRAEHAEELQLMQRARLALEDASAAAGELSLELRTRVSESEEAIREADVLRRSLEARERALEEQRAQAEALEGKVAALSEESEQTRRALAAREAELEQLWRELDVKSREAEELARLMAAFTPGALGDEALAGGGADTETSAASAEDVTASGGSTDESVGDSFDEPPAPPDEPPAPPDEAELSDAPSGDALPRFAEVPDVGQAVPAVHDVMDELGDFEEVPPPPPRVEGEESEGSEEPALVLEEEADPAPPAEPVDATAPAETAGAEADGADGEDAPAVDVPVDDWGAVVEGEEATASAEEAAASRAAIDGELQAYLSDVGGTARDAEDDAKEPQGTAPSTTSGPYAADALFKATSGISDFQCTTPDEVRLAGALQLQSWSSSELAQLLGIEEGVVREKLAAYHERGLVEVVSA